MRPPPRPGPPSHPPSGCACPLLNPAPVPQALTVRSPPGQPPASWPICGSTTSSTEISARYVPAIQGRQGHGCGAWEKDIGEGLGNHVEQETQGEGNSNKETRGPRQHPGTGGLGSRAGQHTLCSPLHCRRATERKTSWAHRQGLPGGREYDSAQPRRDGLSPELLVGQPGGED